MNTHILLTASALVTAGTGIPLIFIPEAGLEIIRAEVNPSSLLAVQVAGGLYFGYSILNWMSRNSLIGGIYNRPVTLTNIAHFLVGGLALVKGIIANPDLPNVIWTTGILYSVFGILFILLLFKHPEKVVVGR